MIVDRDEIAVYLRIAAKAMHLRALGMSDRAIAEALSVSAKTVAKSAQVAVRGPSGRGGRGLRAPGAPLEDVLELGGDA
jgi:hypothetical protein